MTAIPTRTTLLRILLLACSVGVLKLWLNMLEPMRVYFEARGVSEDGMFFTLVFASFPFLLVIGFAFATALAEDLGENRAA